MKKCLIVLLMFSFGFSMAQTKTFNEESLSISPLIEGLLITPESTQQLPLVIVIGGSGPVDRDGNQMMSKNNSLRFLAEGLYEKQIAVFRYDKRIVKLMKKGNLSEDNIRFGDFIEDAILVLDYFKNDVRFSKIYVIGHSQGSLVGMIASQGRTDGFISIAGAGQEIDDVIVDQIAKQAPGLEENARTSFDDLRVNGVSQNYSPGLASIFRPSIQPFILSWMQYDPQVELSKLTVPILIINGDKDLQVQISEAELLYKAKPEAKYVIIKNMNHIMKEIHGDDLENQKSYNEYSRPIISELIDIISTFILD